MYSGIEYLGLKCLIPQVLITWIHCVLWKLWNTRNPGYYYLGNQTHANDLLKCIMFSMQCEDTWWPASKWFHLLSTCCLQIISLIIWKIMFPLGKCLRRIQVLRYRIPGFEVFDSPGINNLGSLCSLETFGPCSRNTLNPGY